MDAATRIFRRIVGAGEEGLQNMCEERYFESALLDFKEASRHKDENKRLLAKSLGGFANTDGGVLVWGVKARASDGIDGALELKPIPQVRQFASTLNIETPQVLSPCPDGIEHHVIMSGSNAESGYVVSLVPYWDGYPVRSAMGEKGADFFMRVGHRFERMPYSFLADRFGRRPQPKLRVRATLKLDKSSRNMTLRFRVINEGRGVATQVAVVIDWAFSMVQTSGWGMSSSLGVPEDGFECTHRCWEAPYPLSIFPGTSRTFASYYEVPSDHRYNALTQEGNIAYQVFCDGFSHYGVLDWKLVRDTETEQVLELEDVKPSGGSE